MRATFFAITRVRSSFQPSWRVLPWAARRSRKTWTPPIRVASLKYAARPTSILAPRMLSSHHSNESSRLVRYISANALRVAIALVLSLCPTAPYGARTGAATPDAGAAPAAAQTATAHPEIVLDATRRDYGEVFAGEELDFPFYIVNSGKAPLELSPRSLTSRSSTSESGFPNFNRMQTRPARYALVPVAAILAAPT